MKPVSRADVIRRAQRRYAREGAIEVDDGADVSPGDDNGAYVQAWVWVEFEDDEAFEEAPDDA